MNKSNLHWRNIIIGILFGFLSCIFLTRGVNAYLDPVSNEFMPPYCPPRSDGTKDTNCIYIPKSQCTHFVSKQGNDNSPGTEAQPFATIRKGVTVMSAGKTLCIKGYTDGSSYNEQVTINNKNGATNQWITIGGYEPDKQVTLKGNNSKNQDYNGVFISGSTFVRLVGMEITHYYVGVETSNRVKNIDLINLHIHENWGIGINISSSANTTTDTNEKVRIEHSQIYDNLRKNADLGNGGGGAQILGTRLGGFRYNKLYLNFGEGLNIGNESNQIIIEDNYFGENKHFSFYINHASNILYHRNLTICTGERLKWMLESFPPDFPPDKTDGQVTLGTAIIMRNENDKSENAGFDRGGNSAILNNVVMGCTEHFWIGVTGEKEGEPPVTTRQQSALIANNTFIDAREAVRIPGTEHWNYKKGKPVTDEAQLLGFDGRSHIFVGDVYAHNNLLIAHASPVNIIPQSAVNISKIHMSNNMSNRSPGFSEGIIVNTNLPFQAVYDHTTFFGSNPKPWELTDTQLDTIKRRFLLANNSPAINAGTVDLPQEFRALYQDYFTRDYFNQARTGAPDIGAHESDGTEPPPPSSSPSSRSSPGSSPLPSASPTGWDLNSDGKINAYDFVKLVKGIGSEYTIAQIKIMVLQFLVD